MYQLMAGRRGNCGLGDLADSCSGVGAGVDKLLTQQGREVLQKAVYALAPDEGYDEAQVHDVVLAQMESVKGRERVVRVEVHVWGQPFWDRVLGGRDVEGVNPCRGGKGARCFNRPDPDCFLVSALLWRSGNSGMRKYPVPVPMSAMRMFGVEVGMVGWMR